MGLSIGLGVAYYAYWQGKAAVKPSESALFAAPIVAANIEKPATAAPPEAETPAADTKESFDFYTILPEMKMAAPEPAPTTVKPLATPTTTTVLQLKPEASTKVTPEQVKGSGVYILQVGSFRQHREADGMKARLALLGVEAKIQTVKSDKNTMHRVRIGPLNDLGKLNTLRTRLHGSNINAVVLKISS